MATLEWNAQWQQDLPAMDDTHRELVDLMTQLEQASDVQLPQLWQQLIDHTQAHFAMEDRWMQDTGFAAENCHSQQHQVVLGVLREAAHKARAGEVDLIRVMLLDLASWFSYHAQTMDAALAQHLRNVGYDTARAHVAHPSALPVALVLGCGGACGTGHDHEVHAAVVQQAAQAAAASAH